MKAQISKIDTQRSKLNGSTVYMVCFKCEDGKSRNSWIDSSYRNFSHWHGLLKVGNILDNLVVKGKSGNIDADSFPKLCRPQEIQEIVDEAMPREEKVVPQTLFNVRPEL